MEFTCPSGIRVKLRLSDSTLRLVLKNPLIGKVFAAVADGGRPEMTNEEALRLWENLDRLVARVVSEPALFVPADLEEATPEGMVSIEVLETADKLAIWAQVIAASGDVMRLEPFRDRPGRVSEPAGDS